MSALKATQHLLPMPMDELEIKKPELNVRAVRSLALFFESRYGRGATDEIFKRTGLDRSYLDDDYNWVSMAWRDRLIQEMMDYSKDRRFAYRAGCYTASREAVGMGYSILASFSRPRFLYQKLFDLASHFNKVGHFDIVELTENSLTCTYQPISDEYMDDGPGADFRLGQLVSMPRLCGLPDAEFDPPRKIIRNGRPAYHYVFRWQSSRSMDPLYGALLGAALGLTAMFLLSEFGLVAGPQEVIAGALLGTFIGWVRLLRRRIEHLQASVRAQEEEMSRADEALLGRFYEIQALNHSLNQQLLETQQINQELEAANQEKQQLNARLEAKVEELEAANQEKQGLNAALEAKVEELEAADRENQGLNAELAAKLAELQQANRRNEELNATLQQRVDEQTIELRGANQRLEVTLLELRKMDQVKTQFFANINHELRTPLHLILAPLESILSDNEHSIANPHRLLLQTMRQNGLKLLKLINSLLDLNKSIEGEMRLKYEQTDLNALLGSVLEAVKPSIARHHLELRKSFQEGLAPVMVDTEKIEAAVLNLLSNAMKFTPNGGQIEVATEQTDSHVLVRVRDTGHGIAPNRLPRIFDRFTDGGTESERGWGGSGIGLSLVREFIQLHNGRCEVESELGVGTTFTLVLPRGEGTVRPELWERRRNPQSGVPLSRRRDDSVRMVLSEYVSNMQEINLSDFRGLERELELGPLPRVEGRHTLLVIEDNADMLYLLIGLLRNDYNLITATNPLLGEAAARTHLPDLILSDVQMAEKDGISLLRDLRADPKTREIPVILMSADAKEDTRIKGIELGAHDFLTKPFSIRELKARIDANISRTELLRELQKLNEELKDKKLALERLVRTDTLTGVYNRYHLKTTLPDQFHQARMEKMPFACIMLDIDHFRDFNTKYGHEGGDEVLRGVGRELREWFEGIGMAVRLGGEEFAVFLPGYPLSEAEQVAQLFLDSIRRTTFGAQGQYQVTLSIGVASWPELEVEDYEHLMRLADIALYRAKETRNTVRVATAAAAESAPTAQQA